LDRIIIVNPAHQNAADPSPAAPERSAESDMSHQDVDYYERRAEVEIEMAQRSENHRAVQAHYDLATFYLDKIYGEPEPAE
jgi:hypothetical protein